MTSATVCARCSEGQQTNPLREHATTATSVSNLLGSQIATRLSCDHALFREIGRERVGGVQSSCYVKSPCTVRTAMRSAHTARAAAQGID